MKVIWSRVYRMILIAVIVSGLAFITLVATGVLTVARGHGDSMMPTLADGELYLMTKVDPDKIQRGDIVGAVLEDGTRVKKRVIGLPFQEVYIGYSTIWIDGDWISEPYLPYPGWNDFGDYDVEMTLGPDEFYLMGDNRQNSWSGIVTREQIIGRVVAK